MNDKLSLKSRYIKAMLFILKQDIPIPSEKIAKEIGISKNTLKRDLSIIANYLLTKNLTLIRKPRIGIYIKGSKKNKELLVKELNDIKDKNEYVYDKKSFIIKLFLTNNNLPTIEDLCEILQISRPTAVKYMKFVKEWFRKRKMLIVGKSGVGYEIKGGEENKIRNALIDFIQQYKRDTVEKVMTILMRGREDRPPIELFKQTDFKMIAQFIEQVEFKTDTTLTDKDYVNLALRIAISIERMRDNHLITIEPKKLFNIMQNPIYKIIYRHKYILENGTKLTLPPEEIAYITLSFISSKVQESSVLKAIPDGDKNEYADYAKLIAKMAEEIFGLKIENDREFVHMLALHLKSTLNKIKYGLKIENPLLAEIKEEYPLSFSIAEKVATMLGNKINIKIPDEEAGYIALYIAMAVEKLKHGRKKRKKIAVICAMAMGTSSLLFWRLLNEMPDIDVIQVGSYKDVVEGKIDPEIDLIVSTIPLPELEIPHIVVSPFLNTKERRKIRELLGILKKKPAFELMEELDDGLIFPLISVSNSATVIKILGNELFKRGYVKDGFVRAVIKREKKFPTGLNTIIPIALPHTGAEYTIKQGIAIATLKNPVKFIEMADGKTELSVRIVIMPVLTPHNENNTTLYEILQKCRNPKIANQLINVKTSYEIKRILSYSST